MAKLPKDIPWTRETELLLLKEVKKMWKCVLLIQFIASLFAVVLTTTAHSAATKTFEIVAVAICEESDTTVCGFNSVDDLRQHLRNRLFWTNELFRPTGISFRLDEVHVVEDNDHYEFPGCRDDNGDYRVALANEWAAGDPERLYWFAFQKSTGGCCAVFPWSSGATNVVYCTMIAGRSNIAHEYGHSFCLLHTFSEINLGGGVITKWDPVNGAGDHNGDGIADTPLDPGGREQPKAGDNANSLHHDVSVDSQGNILQVFANHDWCVANQFNDVDPDSVGPSWCTLDCTRVDGVGNENILVLDGNVTSNILSYWPGRGPFTRMGVRTEGVSPMQIQRVASCLVDYPDQRGYTNQCPNGDFDHDGWCNFEDNCPGVYNFNLNDSDGDGIGDACDNCINDSNHGQEDLDKDGVGDVCDPDVDGDGCCNPWDPDCPAALADQHPWEAYVEVGTIKYVGCPGGSESGVLYAFEGQHSDNDGLLNCQDDDDDGDGVNDMDDPCPIHSGTDPALCQEPRPCNKPWPEYCVPFCGPGLFAKLVSVINPDPTREMVWDHVAVFDNALHLGTSFSTPFSEQMGAFLGSFQFSGLSSFAAMNSLAPDILELQLWSGDPFGIARFVKVLARFEALTPDMLGDPRFGRSLIVEQSPDVGIAVYPTWLLGMPRNAALPDADSDGVPDIADNCGNVPNPSQADRDHDGYGDHCDADFNQDGLVDMSEVLLVQDCLSVDLTWICNPAVENYPDDYPPCDSAKAEAVIRCQDRDLNGDRHIDADDVALAMTLMGHPPGPSGLVDIITNKPPVAVCKDVTVATQSGLCTADASIDDGSFDPDGDPFTLVQSPAGPYPLGNTSVTLTVTDPSGASSSCSATVTVVDQEAPVIGEVSASPNILWPPNHKMVAVAVIANGTDNCNTAPACKIVSVMSNEPIDGLGDGDKAPDWMITGDLAVNLRAERSGVGSGRIYTITVECADTPGNSSSKTTMVTVPKDQCKKK